MDWGGFHSLGAARGCCRAPRWKCGDVALQQYAPVGCGAGEGRRRNADNHFLCCYTRLGAKTDSTSLLHTMCSIARFLCNGKHRRVSFCQVVGRGQKILLLMVGEGEKGLCTQEASHLYKAETDVFYLNISKACGFPYISGRRHLKRGHLGSCRHQTQIC